MSAQSTLILAFFGYAAVIIFKLWLLMDVSGAAYAAQTRARVRYTGHAHPVYRAIVASTMWVALSLAALFWPLLLISEGSRFWRRYDSFSLMLAVFRTVRGVHCATQR